VLDLWHGQRDHPGVGQGGWVFEFPDGRHAEIFGSSYRGKEHFETGPVGGFAVRDLPAAVDELRRVGVELLGAPAAPRSSLSAA
jgi:hypothetical protein